MLGGEVAAMFARKMKHHDDGEPMPTLVAYERVEDIPMDEARRILNMHLAWAYGEFRALGAPDFDVSAHGAQFFGHMEDVLPPRGAYYLAHDPEGRAVATGALRRISEEIGEMKHLFVSPEARGTGIGRALVEARIEAARRLGIKVLVADTFRGNAPMIRLYHRLGFGDAEPFQSAVATITPDLIPQLQYFRMAL